MVMKPESNETAANEPLPSLVGSALEWRPHPERPNTLQGYRPSQPGTTLFRIEIREDKPHRGRLLGAFIPDAHERSDDTTGLVVWLKFSAEIYMRDWVDDFISPNAKVSGGE